MLKVEAIGAQDLKKYDVLGKSDPFLEVFTLPLHKVCWAVAESHPNQYVPAAAAVNQPDWMPGRTLANARKHWPRPSPRIYLDRHCTFLLSTLPWIDRWVSCDAATLQRGCIGRAWLCVTIQAPALRV